MIRCRDCGLVYPSQAQLERHRAHNCQGIHYSMRTTDDNKINVNASSSGLAAGEGSYYYEGPRSHSTFERRPIPQQQQQGPLMGRRAVNNNNSDVNVCPPHYGQQEMSPPRRPQQLQQDNWASPIPHQRLSPQSALDSYYINTTTANPPPQYATVGGGRQGGGNYSLPPRVIPINANATLVSSTNGGGRGGYYPAPIVIYTHAGSAPAVVGGGSSPSSSSPVIIQTMPSTSPQVANSSNPPVVVSFGRRSQNSNNSSNLQQPQQYHLAPLNPQQQQQQPSAAALPAVGSSHCAVCGEGLGGGGVHHHGGRHNHSWDRRGGKGDKRGRRHRHSRSHSSSAYSSSSDSSFTSSSEESCKRRRQNKKDHQHHHYKRHHSSRRGSSSSSREGRCRHDKKSKKEGGDKKDKKKDEKKDNPTNVPPAQPPQPQPSLPPPPPPQFCNVHGPSCPFIPVDGVCPYHQAGATMANSTIPYPPHLQQTLRSNTQMKQILSGSDGASDADAENSNQTKTESIHHSGHVPDRVGGKLLFRILYVDGLGKAFSSEVTNSALGSEDSGLTAVVSTYCVQKSKGAGSESNVNILQTAHPSALLMERHRMPRPAVLEAYGDDDDDDTDDDGDDDGGTTHVGRALPYRNSQFHSHKRNARRQQRQRHTFLRQSHVFDDINVKDTAFVVEIQDCDKKTFAWAEIKLMGGEARRVIGKGPCVARVRYTPVQVEQCITSSDFNGEMVGKYCTITYEIGWATEPSSSSAVVGPISTNQQRHDRPHDKKAIYGQDAPSLVSEGKSPGILKKNVQINEGKNSAVEIPPPPSHHQQHGTSPRKDLSPRHKAKDKEEEERRAEKEKKRALEKQQRLQEEKEEEERRAEKERKKAWEKQRQQAEKEEEEWRAERERKRALEKQQRLQEEKEEEERRAERERKRALEKQQRLQEEKEEEERKAEQERQKALEQQRRREEKEEEDRKAAEAEENRQKALEEKQRRELEQQRQQQEKEEEEERQRQLKAERDQSPPPAKKKPKKPRNMLPLGVQGTRRALIKADGGTMSDADEAYNANGSEDYDLVAIPHGRKGIGRANHPLLDGRPDRVDHNARRQSIAAPLLDACELVIDCVTGLTHYSLLSRVCVYLVDPTDFTNAEVVGIPNTRSYTNGNDMQLPHDGPAASAVVVIDALTDRRTFSAKITELLTRPPSAVFYQDPNDSNILSPRFMGSSPLRCRLLTKRSAFLLVLETLDHVKNDRFVLGHALIPFYSKGAKPGNYYTRVFRGPPAEETFLMAGHDSNSYMNAMAKIRKVALMAKAVNAFGGNALRPNDAGPSSLFGGDGNIVEDDAAANNTNDETTRITSSASDFLLCGTICYQLKRRATIYSEDGTATGPLTSSSPAAYPLLPFNGYAPQDEASRQCFEPEQIAETERYAAFNGEEGVDGDDDDGDGDGVEAAKQRRKEMAALLNCPPSKRGAPTTNTIDAAERLFAERPMWYDVGAMLRLEMELPAADGAVALFYKAMRDQYEALLKQKDSGGRRGSNTPNVVGGGIASSSASSRQWLPPVGFGASNTGAFFDHSALVPFSSRRGVTVFVEQLKGLGPSPELYKVAVHVPSSREVFQFTRSHDLGPQSDLSCPRYSLSDALPFKRIRFDKASGKQMYGFLRLFKITDPVRQMEERRAKGNNVSAVPLSVDERVEEVGWSLISLFNDDGSLRNGRFVLPWFAGTVPVGMLRDLEDCARNPLAAILTRWMNRKGSEAIQPVDGSPVVVVNTLDPLRLFEYVTRRRLYRHEIKPLLISKPQFTRYPIAEEAGRVGLKCSVILRRKGVRVEGETDEIVAKKLLYEANDLMEAWVKRMRYAVPNTILAELKRSAKKRLEAEGSSGGKKHGDSDDDVDGEPPSVSSATNKGRGTQPLSIRRKPSVTDRTIGQPNGTADPKVAASVGGGGPRPAPLIRA